LAQSPDNDNASGSQRRRMKLLELLKNESKASGLKLAFMSTVAGLSNASVLAIINSASEQIAKHEDNIQYVAYFALSMAAYMISQKYIMVTSSSEVEHILDRFRVRLVRKIRNCDLDLLERLGRSEIYASISKETQTISQAVTTLVVGLQSGILILFTSLYLAWLSLSAFLISVIFVSVAVSIHFEKAKDINDQFHEAARRENKLMDALTDVMNGFKEVKMNTRKGDALLAHLERLSRSTADIKIETQTVHASHLIFSQGAFYLLLATIVFIVPRFTPMYDEVLVKMTTAILFLVGPITALAGSIPVLANANASAENIYMLESRLSQSGSAAPKTKRKIDQFKTITFNNVFYSYQDVSGTTPFSVGPINLTVRAGEMIFVSGGNGSGKSTFLKLLTALYYPVSGVIKIDDAILDESNREAYRNLFSVIFTDYHLFKKLHGLGQVDPEKVSLLLNELGLAGKTTFAVDEFETLELSTGRKKRLALLVSLLEDKSIYIFDEWAADQDPAFRRKFYEDMLPALKKAGKTIIAVTHDDKYFDVADRRLKMAEGCFLEGRDESIA
jgi:putative ATP-binding cassette transporter